MDFEKIIDESLKLYSESCKAGIYRLFSSKEYIRNKLIDSFKKSKNNDSDKIRSLIEICEVEVFSSINSQKLVYSWFIEENHSALKRKIMNTFHQQVL